MQFRRSVGVGVLVGALLLAGAVLAVLLWRYPEVLGIQVGSDRQSIGLMVALAATFVLMMVLGGSHLTKHRLGRSFYRQQTSYDAVDPAPVAVPESTEADLRKHLRTHHGPFWRRKVRVLLVVGEPTEVDAIAPYLTTEHWLEGQNTVLLWGGSVQSNVDETLRKRWRGLSRWRAFDGVVWALSAEQSAQAARMDLGVRCLRELANSLRWQLPLYLWQVNQCDWSQAKRPVQPVGCALPERFSPEALEVNLERLVQPLREQGWAQVAEQMGHDFLWRLSRDLEVEGIARWRQALAPLFGSVAGQWSRGVPLRGLWFSLALPAAPTKNNGELEHVWLLDPAWAGVLGEPSGNVRRLGWHPIRVGQVLMLSAAAVWGAGMLLSFVSNRALIEHVQASVATLQQAAPGDVQFSALNELVRELGRLDYRAEHGVPWHQRFGLSQNQALLERLWPRYVEANHRLLRDPAAANLRRQLSALVKLAPDSPERARLAPQAYAQLKAYLMLAHPEKADPVYLAKVLNEAEPLRAGLSPGLWQGLAPGLWRFFAEQLPAHPQWRIEADPVLIVQARQVLLGQLGQRNAEASLYQTVLDAAANHYPALSLQHMVADTDAQALLTSQASVPGVFTRQAWDGHIRQAIDAIAQARREEIDWVLSDRPADIATDLTPDVLKQRLTERYFQDYSGAWLAFLNNLRWQRADSLAEVIDQLTLMSDVRQSPVIALMNTLAWQGQAGTWRQALADSLIESAQQLMTQDKVPLIDQSAPGTSSPLDATFGPLLALLGKDVDGKNANDSLSLQAFLTRVTRVRLKLQHVSNAPDPQDMTQALAQTVFQGKNVDLTDTQAYGSLLAASLGAEWGGVGQTLFVQPLDQAWQRVLQPSAAGLNRQWQRSIVSDWQSAFASRYPFAATHSDASLPMLGQMIRADSGRIEQFLQQQLGGVLRKEGSRWVADSRHSQGLRFNPQFINAINLLSHLGDVLYTDGGMGLGFELSGKAARDIVQTTFTLNGEKHHYFNQKESWQRFNWPGRSDHPGAMLTWTSVRTGERLFGDYQGTWGLIRLLEKAKITPLEDGESRYRMVLKAPDGLELTWHLRTELGAGPLALLKLRGFTLPTQIFLSENDAAAPSARHGSVE